MNKQLLQCCAVRENRDDSCSLFEYIRLVCSLLQHQFNISVNCSTLEVCKRASNVVTGKKSGRGDVIAFGIRMDQLSYTFTCISTVDIKLKLWVLLGQTKKSRSLRWGVILLRNCVLLLVCSVKIKAFAISCLLHFAVVWSWPKLRFRTFLRAGESQIWFRPLQCLSCCILCIILL